MNEDLISRRAAIDAIGDEPKYKVRLFGKTYDEGRADQWWHDIGAIHGLPSAEPQWIPVTEGLPEDGAEVWVTTEMLSEVTRARWHKDSGLWCHPYNADCLLVLRPIAWMEMLFPEPYKGGVE